MSEIVISLLELDLTVLAVLGDFFAVTVDLFCDLIGFCEYNDPIVNTKIIEKNITLIKANLPKSTVKKFQLTQK
jgi:hypothetical protein